MCMVVGHGLPDMEEARTWHWWWGLGLPRRLRWSAPGCSESWRLRRDWRLSVAGAAGGTEGVEFGHGKEGLGHKVGVRQRYGGCEDEGEG